MEELVGIDQIEDPAEAAREQEEIIRASETPFTPTKEQIEAERELIKKAEGKYAPEEVKEFITIGKKLAAKAVLTVLCDTIMEYPGDTVEQKKLVHLVEGRMPYNYCGYVTCEFNEITHKLHVCLSKVPADYKTDISVPDAKYANDLFRQYNFLKGIATAFWAQFIEENNGLFVRICNYVKKLDLSQLVIDKTNPTTLYFNKSGKTRVGIFAYYVDENGRPLKKR